MQVWWCPLCQYTKPRWYKDLVQDLMKGGIHCPCGTRMKLRLGTEVNAEYRKELEDSGVVAGDTGRKGQVQDVPRLASTP